MNASESNRALRDRIDALGRVPATSYAAGMWRYALANEGLDAPAVSADCDAVPYLPVEPEAFGLALDGGSRLLDIGCLGGYGLFDIARRRSRAGRAVPRMVGVDRDAASVRAGRELAPLWAAGGEPAFACARAEALPFADGRFDLVVARLLLPYVRVQECVAEIARVLCGGGLALFQSHGFGYYARSVRQHAASPRLVLYYARPILSGAFFAAFGRQPRSPWFRETAMGFEGLGRLCRACGLTPVWRGGFAERPLALCRKQP